MLYKAYLEQENNTKICIDIDAQSYEEAALSLKKIIRKKYSFGCYKLKFCELYEISNSLVFDLDLIYNELEKDKNDYITKSTEQKSKSKQVF
jgi:hypothetical protein